MQNYITTQRLRKIVFKFIYLIIDKFFVLLLLNARPRIICNFSIIF